MNNKLINAYINGIRNKVEEPLVTANFGDTWKIYAKDIPHEELIDIAWLQGRYAIILERALRRQLEIESEAVGVKRLEHFLKELNQIK